MYSSEELEQLISNCLLPKLAHSVDEREEHIEFDIRIRNLPENCSELIVYLGNTDIKYLTPRVLSRLLILLKEIQTDGPWNAELPVSQVQRLIEDFGLLYECNLDKLLNCKGFDVQSIFEECMHYLHQKLTQDQLKKYPALIEVYRSVIYDIKDTYLEYELVLNPVKILPVSLLLIDDYLPENKTKGLKCCIAALRCMTPKDFEQGNYYEVILIILKKTIMNKDVKITKLVLSCFMETLRILPEDRKGKSMDEMFSCVLEQLYTESNLQRKVKCLKFINSIIEIHRLNCMKKYKLFKKVICDNIEVCCNEGVGEILLADSLECLDTWLRYCWSVWDLSTDRRILVVLLKILHTDIDEILYYKVYSLIMTIMRLCTNSQKKEICESLDQCSTSNQEYADRIQCIKKEIEKHINIK